MAVQKKTSIGNMLLKAIVKELFIVTNGVDKIGH